MKLERFRKRRVAKMEGHIGDVGKGLNKHRLRAVSEDVVLVAAHNKRAGRIVSSGAIDSQRSNCTQHQEYRDDRGGEAAF